MTTGQLSRRIVKKTETRYCGQYLPRAPIPAGRSLVHNHVKPCNPLGLNGFRAWTQNTREELVECNCDLGGCKNAELHKHCRVRTLSKAHPTRSKNGVASDAAPFLFEITMLAVSFLTTRREFFSFFYTPMDLEHSSMPSEVV